VPSPFDNLVPFEKQIPVASLGGLSTALARALGDLGVGSGDISTLLAGAVEAQCVLCRITVSGTELISAGLGTDTAGAGPNEKLARLRLGYCCRNGCASSFYVVRFAPRPGVEWSELWDRLCLGPSTEPAEDVASSPRWRNLLAAC
jgi:hypothetical protein